MPPFTQDAMGDIIPLSPESYSTIEAALHIQKTLGIKVSATFNNIKVSPTQKNLDLFIHNFRQLYAAGVRSATIPHTHWIATGQIQHEFPELLIKNTILRNVHKANEVAQLAQAGFHYINIDRDLMRDRGRLIEIRRAADKYGVKIALLANEGCVGGCSMMDEHFEFNNSRTEGVPAYFHDSISRVSCPKWDNLDMSVPLKTANIPPWKSEWDEFLDYVDVFKMHGRESVNQLYNSMDIIRRYSAGEEILFDGFEEYLDDNNLEDKPIQAWRTIIKTCRFECWDCSFCDKVYEKKSTKKSNNVVVGVVNELIESVMYNNNITTPGLTSKRVQNLIHGICSNHKTYLEIGSAMGATAVAAAGTPDLTIHCVDMWKDNIFPQTFGSNLPANTISEFKKNTAHIKNITIHNCDYMKVDRSLIQNVDVMFYDGPHDAASTKNAVEYYKECLSEVSVLIFDDANWNGVVEGADAGINSTGLKVLYKKLILNDVEDKNMWWNGVYILVVQK